MLTLLHKAKLLNFVSTVIYSLTTYKIIGVNSLPHTRPASIRRLPIQYKPRIAVFPPLSSTFTTTSLSMRGRKKGNDNSNAMGKTILKQNLPSKICVTCNRPFTWRKKWESVWDEVTTCSKSCNAKRRNANKKADDISNDDVKTQDFPSSMGQQAACLINEDDSDSSVESNDNKYTSSSPSSSPNNHKNAKAMIRKEHKKAVKELKSERRLKRSGKADPSITRKPCHLCSKPVDLLIRCTIDESLQYHMVCGRCWKDVSGGVVDGDKAHPYYKYGGLWKNRYADLKKRVGNGDSKSTNNGIDDYSKDLEIDENLLKLLE